jgi:light-regulated signal transduction histidine kinase (bacteriophytochrome)
VLQWLVEKEFVSCASTFTTENLFKLGYPNAKQITQSCAGVLVIQVAGETHINAGEQSVSAPPIFVVWCQMEIKHEIRWAGAKDAERDVMSDGSKQLVMGPRNSFDVFVELSADCCEAWKPTHVRPVQPNPR